MVHCEEGGAMVSGKGGGSSKGKTFEGKIGQVLTSFVGFFSILGFTVRVASCLGREKLLRRHS